MNSISLQPCVKEIERNLRKEAMIHAVKGLFRTAVKFLIPPRMKPAVKRWGRRIPYIFQRADLANAKLELEKILAEHSECKGIIALPPSVDWDWMKQRPHHLIAEFAKAGYLVFFCSPRTQTDSFRGFKKAADCLYLCSYPEILSAGLERPIVFATNPGHLDEVRLFKNPRVIYDHLDDLRVHCASNKVDRLALERHTELLRIAEIVSVTAGRLHNRVLAIRPDAVLCPNGVHYDHFALKHEPSIPADLAKIKASGKPIIGYYGALAKWFDYELVKWLANRCPQYEFVLIGTNYDHSLNRRNLHRFENLHWLGEKKYEELPDYAYYFNVATIPFVINEITLCTSPVKLFEYMAAGKPIVTTDLPECRKYRSVLLARDREEFAAQLVNALELAGDAGYRKTLSEEAHANTWRSRFEQIEACLERKPAYSRSAA